MTTKTDEIYKILEKLNTEEKEILLKEIRKDIPIHHLEKDWNISAEFVLEAISRSQDITKRGVRGIIAELCFSHYIIEPFTQATEWKSIPLIGDLAYDSLIRDKNGKEVKIQIKNQRVTKGIPLLATAQAKKKFSAYPGWWIAECQKTRNGTDETGSATRPYRFGEFDILAVCLHPSTNDWSKFMFIDSTKLFPRASDTTLIDIMQPVAPTTQGDWFDNLNDCVNNLIK